MEDFVSKLYGKEDDNPISLLMYRMKFPLTVGIATGIALQGAKGVIESPATFGRIAYTTLPLCGLGFYYLSGTYIIERIRGKDGPLNNLLGAYCTFPVIRKYLPLTHTLSVLFFISLPLYIVARGFKCDENSGDFSKAASFGIQMTSIDINLLLQKDPSEPFVKRESYNPFTIEPK